MRISKLLRAAPPASAKASNNARGVALLAISGLLFTIEVALVRIVGTGATIEHVIACRAFAQLGLVGAYFFWTGEWRALQSRRPGLHLARGLASITSWWFYYASFLELDLALATTLTFTTQLFVVALAGPFLGERVDRVRAGLTALGFCGVAIVTRVWDAAFDPAIIYGVASAISGAAIVLISRALTRTETTPTILFYIGIITSIAALGALAANPQPIAPSDLALIILAGILGVAGMGIMIEAFRTSEVSALAPAPYLRLVFAIIFGFVLFGEVPTWTTLMGATLIVAAALVASRQT